MDSVRERILLDVSESLRNFPYADHDDLISFVVTYECFMDCEDVTEKPDFNEVIAIVDKNWLFNKMKSEYDELNSDEDCRKFLMDEYTSDDSLTWFDDAAKENKLMMIAFE